MGKKKKEKKKRKSLIGKLLTLIFSLVVVVGVVLGVFIYFVYDDSVDDYKVKDNYTTEQLKNELIYSGFQNVAETGTLEFALSQEMLNSLLKEAFSSVSESTNGIVESAYVLIDGTSYKFNFRFKYTIIETKLVIDATLKEDSENKQIVFEFNSIKAGKITADFLVDMVSSKVDDATIDDIFSSVGLSIKADIANKRLTYAYADFYKDIETLLGETESVTNLKAIIGLVEENELFYFANGQDYCSLNLDLTDFTYNPEFTEKTGNADLVYRLDGINEEAETLLDHSLITSDDSKLIYKYLMFGYAALSEEEQDTIKTKDLSLIELNTSDTSYTGHFVKQSEPDIATEFLKNLEYTYNPLDLPSSSVKTTLEEATINQLLRSQDILGDVTAFPVELENSHKNIYLSVDDIYVNIVNGSLDLILDINLNGYPISFVDSLQYETIDTDNYSLSFSQNGLYFGSTKASEEIEDMCFDYLIEATNSIDLISIDTDTHDVNMHFDSYLDTEINGFTARLIFDAVKNFKTIEASLNGDSLSDENACITIQSVDE